MIRPPPRSTLFPYPTLFRSVTSQGTSTEELAQGAGILVDPHNPDSIAAGLERALGDDGRLAAAGHARAAQFTWARDRKSTRLNSSHANISYAVFCLKTKIWY